MLMITLSLFFCFYINKFFIHNDIIYFCIVILSSIFIIICIHRLFYKYSYNNKSYYNNLDSISINDTYHLLKYGDVLFLKEYIFEVNLNFLLYHNKALYHACLVIEENGIKYIIHATSYILIKNNVNKVNILQKYNHWLAIGNTEWYVIKEPLLEYLLRTKYNIIQVYRHSKPNPIQYKKWKKQKHMTWCTSIVAKLLYDCGMITSSNKLITSFYQTHELTSKLIESGYNQFVFKTITPILLNYNK